MIEDSGTYTVLFIDSKDGRPWEILTGRNYATERQATRQGKADATRINKAMGSDRLSIRVVYHPPYTDR